MGIGICLSFLEELTAPNIIRIVFKAFAVVPFIMMMYQDTAWHRQLFMWFFYLCMPAMFITNLVWYQNILADNVAYAGAICWFSQKGANEAGEGDSHHKNHGEEGECNYDNENDQAECEA